MSTLHIVCPPPRGTVICFMQKEVEQILNKEKTEYEKKENYQLNNNMGTLHETGSRITAIA